MLRQFYLRVEDVKRSMEWLIKRLIKVGAKVAYHGRRWYVHVASVLFLNHCSHAVFGKAQPEKSFLTGGRMERYA